MTLWLLAVTPTRFPLGEQVEDHPGSSVGLAAARRALHGEHRAVELRGDPPDGGQRGFALRSEAFPIGEA